LKPQTLTVGSETRSIGIWAKLTGIQPQAIRARVQRGWTPEQCVGRQAPPAVNQTRRARHSPWKRPNNLTDFHGLEVAQKLVVDSVETGKRAKAIRKAAGKTVAAAAADMGWKIHCLEQLEYGRMSWTPERIEIFNNAAKGWVK
jgi:hypothetical protein